MLDVVGSGGGSPLARDVREDMEARLGADFSDVRVHTGGTAASSAAAVGAQAYTVGNDVVFGAGTFDTTSTAGKTMLAHELTHVVQQRSGPVSGTPTGDGISVSDPGDRFEREAEANAVRVMWAPASPPEVNTAPAPGQPSGARRDPGGAGGHPAAAPTVQRTLDVDQAVSIMVAADQQLQDVRLRNLPELRTYWLENVHRKLVKDFDDLATAREALDRWFAEIADRGHDAGHRARAWERISAEYEPAAPKVARPPSDPRKIGLNTKSRAMEKAQGVNDSDRSSLKDNVELLRKNQGAVFYVYGKSAMGQGDTAFIVRTVNLLNGLGLKAVGVKAEESAHDPGSSFKKSLDSITPQELYTKARPGDFVIEGPLSDPVDLQDPGRATWFDTVAGKFTDKGREIRNLRLYEYGTLTYRGGQQMQQERTQRNGSPVNVVNHAGDSRHAFMGMGHGEIGAFYNSGAGKEERPLTDVLESHAESSETARQIQAVLKQHLDASIFIGYANSSRVAYNWARAVKHALGGDSSSAYSLIVAVYGGKQIQPTFAIEDDGTSITSIINREKGPEPRSVERVKAPEKATGSIILTDSVPAPVMNALQRHARPFTLATGNYSLSEAIENGHLASYEALDFNAGVDADYRWQLLNAMTTLQIDEKLQAAVTALVSPDAPGKRSPEIRLALEHPEDVKRIMAEVRANTDITRLLVGRLASLERARRDELMRGED